MKANFLKLFSAGVSLGITLFASTAQADNFDVSIGLGGEVAPGVYGRVNITNSRPALVYTQPVMIQRADPGCEPVYMHVPPRHAYSWGRYCQRYGACATPVYFVRSPEYARYGGGYVERPRYVVEQPRYVYRQPQSDWNGDGWGYGNHAYRQGYREGYRDNRWDERRERHERREWRHHGRHGWDD